MDSREEGALVQPLLLQTRRWRHREGLIVANIHVTLVLFQMLDIGKCNLCNKLMSYTLQESQGIKR